MGSTARGFTASHGDRPLYSLKRSVRSSTGAGEGSAEPSFAALHSDQRLYSVKWSVRPSINNAGERSTVPRVGGAAVAAVLAQARYQSLCKVWGQWSQAVDASASCRCLVVLLFL